MEQTIRFVTTPDGVKVAYASSGKGPPLLKTANWLNHIEFDWESPVWRHWFALLSGHHRLVRYDARGCGLSDWTDTRLSFEWQVSDLECIVNAAGLDRFALLGISQGAAAAIEFAVRHPERVSHLIIHGGYPLGWAHRGDESVRQGRAMVDLIRFGWGQDTPAYRQLFTSLFIPEGSEEQMAWFSELERRTTRPEIAARILEAFGAIDVSNQLQHVRAPTLVLHARGDARVPFEQGRMLAAGIPDAQFVALEGRNHILLEHEPAWLRFQMALTEFLGWRNATPASADAGASAALSALTGREREILTFVAAGDNNLEIAARLFISEKTVRNHLTGIFDKLGVNSRAQAIVFARDHGIARGGH